MSEPRWDSEGQPANLAAAAEDALEWLKVMRQGLTSISGPRRRKADLPLLEACIAALEKQLAEKGESEG